MLKHLLYVAGAVGLCALLTHSQSAVQPATIQAGLYSALPGSCASNALYLAIDQPAGQQLETCKDGSWYPVLSVGGSGALQLAGGVLDVNPAVVPAKSAANAWPGSNTFSDLRLAATTALACDASVLGRVTVDTANPTLPQVKICLSYLGTPQWRFLSTYGTGW